MLIRINTSLFSFAIIANMSINAFANEDRASANDFIPTKIASGMTHTCILSDQGQVKCWGSNFYGELGLPGKTSYGTTPGTMGPNLPIVNFGSHLYAKDLCVGGTTCVATTDGRVKCWGDNSEGQLGQEREVANVGRQANDMGDNLPFTDLGSDFKVKSVACGATSNCALSDTGKLKCWGNGSNGQLGSNIYPKTNIGRVKGEMGDKLPVIALPILANHVAIGHDHTCAGSHSEIYCWGHNSLGQIGIGAAKSPIYLPTDPNTAIKVKLEDDGVATIIEGLTSGHNHNCALYRLANRVTEQKIKCWGHNSSGELGVSSFAKYMGRTPETIGSKLPSTQLAFDQIAQLEAHANFSCALTKKGDMKCWGYNSFGELGVGDDKTRGTSNDMGNKLPYTDLGLPILEISSGPGDSSCAILINNEIKCWGYGYYGTLGYEDTMNRGNKKDDMGENLPFVRYK